jgi:hypothetical protein
MKITRLYTGGDRKSYFEDIELKFGGDQKILTADSRPATMAVFRCVPPGTFLELHPAPLQCPAPGRSKQATASNESSRPAT